MKKAITLLLAVLMVIGVLAGCGQAPAEESGGTSPSTDQSSEQPSSEEPSTEGLKVGVVIKIAGNPFYTATDIGFAEAGEELGVEFITNGPSEATVEEQIEIIEGFINQKVDAIAIATNDLNAVVPALQKAQNAGIKVISWDSAVSPEGRSVHVNQASATDIGASEIQGIAETIGYEGQIAIVSAGATMVNQNAWIDAMKVELEKPEYENMELVDIVYGDDETQKSYNEAIGLLKTYPDLKAIISPTTVGCAAVSKAVHDQGLTGKVYVTGVGLPSLQAEYIESGINDTVYIWNPIDLGYLSAYTTYALLQGDITGAVGETFSAGRLGEFEITDDGAGGTEVILGPPLELSKDNIDEYKDIF